MTIWRTIGSAVVGGVFGALMATLLHVHSNATVAHAQDQFTTFAGCVGAVPKSWGNFIGASTYGLAFEDNEGTLRFTQHPVCGNAVSTNNAPTPSIDLEILRK